MIFHFVQIISQSQNYNSAYAPLSFDLPLRYATTLTGCPKIASQFQVRDKNRRLCTPIERMVIFMSIYSQLDNQELKELVQKRATERGLTNNEIKNQNIIVSENIFTERLDLSDVDCIHVCFYLKFYEGIEYQKQLQRFIEEMDAYNNDSTYDNLVFRKKELHIYKLDLFFQRKNKSQTIMNEEPYGKFFSAFRRLALDKFLLINKEAEMTYDDFVESNVSKISEYYSKAYNHLFVEKYKKDIANGLNMPSALGNEELQDKYELYFYKKRENEIESMRQRNEKRAQTKKCYQLNLLEEEQELLENLTAKLHCKNKKEAIIKLAKANMNIVVKEEVVFDDNLDRAKMIIELTDIVKEYKKASDIWNQSTKFLLTFGDIDKEDYNEAVKAFKNVLDLIEKTDIFPVKVNSEYLKSQEKIFNSCWHRNRSNLTDYKNNNIPTISIQTVLKAIDDMYELGQLFSK